MMLTLSAVAIDMLAPTTAVLTRAAAGAYVSGRWVPGEMEPPSTIHIVQQPVSGRDLQALPEGERTEEMRAVWTRSTLRPASVDDRTQADTLTFKGQTWKVIRTFPRDEGGYVKAIVGRTSA